MRGGLKCYMWVGWDWDGMDVMGWMVMIGHRFSKSTIGANKNQEM